MDEEEDILLRERERARYLGNVNNDSTIVRYQSRDTDSRVGSCFPYSTDIVSRTANNLALVPTLLSTFVSF